MTLRDQSQSVVKVFTNLLFDALNAPYLKLYRVLLLYAGVGKLQVMPDA